MTENQKIQIRLSEIRSRRSEISVLGEDGLTDEIRAETTALTTEFQELETRHRAAIVAEGEAEERQLAEFGSEGGDGESAEIRSFLHGENSVTLQDYLSPAAAGVGIASRAAELNAALKVGISGPGGGVAVPWRLLDRGAAPARRRPEERAFTGTGAYDGGAEQRPILQRLFGPGVFDALGVRMDTVPVGMSEFPLITGGSAPGQVKENAAAAAAAAAVFGVASLKPKRLSGKYEYSHEAASSVRDLEMALRRDLGDAVKSKMSDIAINGVAPTNANPQNIEGFLVRLGAASDLAAAEATAADYGRLHALAVDGVHAETEDQVMSIIGDETYQHASGVYIMGSGLAGSQLLKMRSGGCYASTYIPDAAGMKQSAILHAAGPNGGEMRGDSVAAMWPTLEVIRDIYSQASQGVVLTWVALWDAYFAFREDAYQRIAIQIA